MGVFAFDPAAFKTRYPNFSAVSDAALRAYFDEACLYLDNTDNSIVADVGNRGLYLGMIVAHLTQIYGGTNGTSGAGGAGRVSNASEGSVSASFDVGPTTMSSAFWYQTPFGIAYWNATAKYRLFRYVAPRCRC